LKELFLKQRLRELFRVEGLLVVRLLAEADEFDGQAEFLQDRHHHAAFARAVQLGHDEAGERDSLVKFTRLVQRVHAGRRVQHQQDFVRRAGRPGPVAPSVQRYRRRGALAHHWRAGGTGISARLKIADEPLADLSNRPDTVAQGTCQLGVAAESRMSSCVTPSQPTRKIKGCNTS